MLDMLEIDEAINQATVRVWRSGARFDAARGSLGAWFFVVARNCARRILESKARRRAEPLSESLAAGDGSEPSEVSAADGSDAGGGDAGAGAAASRVAPRWEADLYKCIQALPPQQRAVMLLDLAAGGNATGNEIARELNTSVNSVYVSRANGRRAVRLAMEALGHRMSNRNGTPGAAERPKPGSSRQESAGECES
jgi:RNA polymerase sigma factor (sigma-70 family)